MVNVAQCSAKSYPYIPDLQNYSVLCLAPSSGIAHCASCASPIWLVMAVNEEGWTTELKLYSAAEVAAKVF